MNSVAYSPVLSKWVAVGYDYNALKSRILTSSDAATWGDLSSSGMFLNVNPFLVRWGGLAYVAVGSRTYPATIGQELVSVDGASWRLVDPLLYMQLSGLCYSARSGRWVTCGYVVSTQPGVATSLAFKP